MKLRDHPGLKDQWKVLIWSSSHGPNDLFSTELPGSELGILKDADVVSGPGTRLRLIREYHSKTQACSIAIAEPFRTKLCNLLKSLRGRELSDVASLEIDGQLDRV
jgi:hypothetical protein